MAEFLRNLDPNCSVRGVPNLDWDAARFFAFCEAKPKTECKLVTSRKRHRVGYFVNQISQGRIYVDLDEQIVSKNVTRFLRFGLVEREIHWLRKLGGTGFAPRLLGASGSVIDMQYVGEPLRHHNLPQNWQDQAEKILECLRRAGCSHNDIKCDNLAVHKGRLSVIDFGWATAIDAPIPADWPTGIGAQHRLGVHRFDDRTAIFAACRQAELDQIRPSRQMKAA